MSHPYALKHAYGLFCRSVRSTFAWVCLSGLTISPLLATDTTAPTPPTSVTASSITPYGFVLTFTGATDNVAVTQYDIYQNGVLAASSVGTSAYIENLTSSTVYPMTVKAKDAAGNVSSASSAVNVTTVAGPVIKNGLTMWYKADVGAFASGGTTIWADQSGAGHNAVQTNASLRPTVVASAINGLPVLRFDGVQDELALPSMAGATAGEIFIVNRVDLANAYNGLAQFGTGYATVYSDGTIWDDFGTSDQDGYSIGNSALLTSFNVYSSSISSDGTSILRVNGKERRRLLGQAVGFRSDPLLGSDYFGEYFKGDIAEVLVYNRALSDFERESVYTYLQSRYAFSFFSTLSKPAFNAYPVSGTKADLSWAVGIDQHAVTYLERQIGTNGYATLSNVEDLTSFLDTGLAPSQSISYRVRQKTPGGFSPYSDPASLTVPNIVDPSTSGLVLWLRASAGIDNQSAIGVWSDQSGLGHDVFQSDPVTKPLWVSNAGNGMPTVRFSGNNLLYVPDFLTSLNAAEVFGVARLTPKADQNNDYWVFGTIQGTGYYNASTHYNDFGSATNQFSTPMPDTELSKFHVINTSSSGGTWVERFNNVEKLRSTGIIYQMSGSPNIGNTDFNGDISEILIYNRALSDSERSSLQQYFAGKYSIGSTDTTAPSVPTGLSYSNLTGNSFTLSWNASTDNVAVTAYQVFTNGSSAGTSATTSLSLTGLSAGTSYNMTVKALDAAGNISAASTALPVTTPSVADTTAPSIPSSLNATARTSTSFTLNWSASTDNIGVTGYTIYKNGASIGTSTTTSFSVTGLTANTAYSITVSAKDAAGNNSAQSTVLSVSTDVTAPTAPTNLAYSGLTATSFLLSWTASTDNVAVTAYDIYQGSTFLGTNGSTSFSVTGISAGVSYTMTVRARDAAGNTATSSSLRVTTLSSDTVAPSVPAGLNATSRASTSFTLNWSASTDNVGVTGYTVYKNGTSIGSPSTTSLAVTGLTANTTYSMTVSAKDAAGNNSAQSTNLSVSTDVTAPSVPTSLAASGLTANSFLLTWTASTDNVGVAGYDVYLNGSFYGSNTGASLSITGLSPSTTYTMVVKARDAAGNITASSSFLVTTKSSDTTAPTIPTGLTASARTSTSFTLSWTASTDNVGVTGYTVYKNGASVGSPTSTSFSVPGLTANTTYTMTVSAKDAAGNASPQSNGLSVSTDVTAPTVPTNLAYSGLTTSSFLLTWTGSTDAVGVAAYDVYQNGTLLGHTNGTSFSVIGLSASTTYTMVVKARDAAGNIATSTSLPVTTQAPDTVAPSAPSSLGYSNLTTSSFLLTWVPSTDNVGIATYDVYENGTLLGHTAATSFSVTGLSAGTTYTMVVKARDSAGNTTPSASFPVTTAVPDSTAPTVPTGLGVTAIQSSSFTLTWAPSTDNVVVAGYTIYKSGTSIGTSVSTSFAVTGLTANTTYTMTVAASDSAGNSSAQSSSLAVTTRPIDTTPPSPPVIGGAAAVGSKSLNIFWSASTDNVEVVSYDVYKNGVYYNNVGGTDDGITGLTALTTYSFYVVAKDSSGNTSSPSATFNVTTTPTDSTSPSAPTGLSASSIGSKTALINWIASSDNVGIQYYEIFVNGSFAVRVGGSPVQLGGLVPSSTSSITIQAIDFDGNRSASSSPLSVTTSAIDTTAPSTPTGLGSSGITSNSFLITWTASTDNIGVVSYNVYKNGALIGSTPITNFGQSNLSPSTTYVMAVTAQDADGNISAQSAPLSVTTTVAGSNTLSPPTTLKALITDYTVIQLNWQAANGTAPAGYDIYSNGAYVGSTSGMNFYTLTGLTPGTAYTLGVVARDAAGNTSSMATLLTATRAADTVLPTVPINLVAGSVTKSTFTLTWSESSDNTAVQTYNIYQNGTLIGSSPTSSFGVVGLSAGQTYTMTVTAVDQAGNQSSPSSSIAVTTSTTLAAPAAPVQPTITGLRLWLKPDAGLPASGAVSSWIDQSTSGDHGSQTTAAAQPQVAPNSLNGYSSVRFDGKQTLVLGNVLGGQAAGEILAVMRVTPAPNAFNNFWRFTQNGSSGYFYNQRSDGFGTADQTWFPDIPVSQYSTYHIEDISAQVGDWSERINGLLVQHKAPAAISFSSTPDLGESSFIGNIVEILVYNRSLTPQEREDVGFYLDRKYNLNVDINFGNYRDSNHDGLTDNEDRSLGIDPFNMDVDGDGIDNQTEISNGTNPFDPDTDHDGVNDGQDFYPLDPTRSQAPASNPNDHTGPTITIDTPSSATLS